MEQAEVVVVGAGLMGSAAARALAARGVPTVLFEQFELGHARGSSHGATRIFRLSHPDPLYVRMAIAATSYWQRISAEAGRNLVMPTGGLDAGPAAEDCATALAQCGAEHTWLSAGQVRDAFPGIAARPGERMLFQPDSGVCLADPAVAALQRLAARDGVSVRAGTPVLGIEPDGDRVALHTPAGEVRARAAIVTAGAWAGGLLAGALPRAPALTATLQQVRYFAPRPGGGAWPTLIEWPDARPCWYVVPAAGGAPGVKVAAHVPGPAVDPRDGPFTELDPAAEADAADYVADRLPGLDPAGFAAETCLYTMTADEDFVLGREGQIVVGGGCSGHAFKFGPLIGEMLAGLVLGEDPVDGQERFALQRPALRLCGAPPDQHTVAGAVTPRVLGGAVPGCPRGRSWQRGGPWFAQVGSSRPTAPASQPSGTGSAGPLLTSRCATVPARRSYTTGSRSASSPAEAAGPVSTRCAASSPSTSPRHLHLPRWTARSGSRRRSSAAGAS